MFEADIKMRERKLLKDQPILTRQQMIDRHWREKRKPKMRKYMRKYMYDRYQTIEGWWAITESSWYAHEKRRRVKGITTLYYPHDHHDVKVTIYKEGKQIDNYKAN